MQKRYAATRKPARFVQASESRDGNHMELERAVLAITPPLDGDKRRCDVRRPLDRGRPPLLGGGARHEARGGNMRDGRWREVEVRHHEREDGAAVRHVEPQTGASAPSPGSARGRRPTARRAPGRQGHHRRFGTPEAAKVPVNRAWP